MYLGLVLLVGCPVATNAPPTPPSNSLSTGTGADQDRDGFSEAEGDCNDDIPTVNPFATDIVGDDIDQNCDGVDGTDQDGDGFASDASGGTDCDDQFIAINPAQTDIAGDAIDQNCDGVDGTDADGDGFASEVSGGADCDDTAAVVNPAADDTVGDGVDQNCDALDGTDADGDGVASEASGGADCDDLAAVVFPQAEDFVGDGIDQNCDGADGVDADFDTFASIASGGTDCDDASVGVHPNAADLVGDGVDQNCDLVDGVDADRDGVASDGSGGLDCADLDPLSGPGFADGVGDGVDQSCDGVDGLDADLDTFASVESGGTDCDDASPMFHPAAADTVGDALDQNCDGLDGIDGDGDGFASESSGGEDCEDDDALVTPLDGDLDGASVCDGDCDDADPGRFPANAEQCNAVDDDCDTVVDFAGPADACARQDVEVAGTGALDVLFVVDDSCSMQAKQLLLVDGVDEFLSELVGFTDLHVGVVTTDMEDANKRGQLQPGFDGSLFIDESYDLATAIAWLEGTVEPGTSGYFDERPLDASYAALELLDSTVNAGFSRPEADTAVIFVTDEADYSIDITPADWEAWFSSYKAPPAAVSVHAFGSPPSNCGSAWVTYSEQVLDLAAAFGGISVSICDPSWAGDLRAIAQASLSTGQFDGIVLLSEVPDPLTIEVEALESNGTVLQLVNGTDYVYDAGQNAVVFTGYDPPVGTTLTVSYRALP